MEKDNTFSVEVNAREADALNTFYRPNATFRDKTIAALKVIPSLLTRAGLLRRAQEYAETGSEFSKGPNVIEKQDTKESYLNFRLKMTTFTIVGLTILNLPLLYSSIHELSLEPRPSNALRIALYNLLANSLLFTEINTCIQLLHRKNNS